VAQSETRRDFLAAATFGVLAQSGPEATFAAIEARIGGRIGVAALDTVSGERLAYRANERFAMCSTFKAMAVAAALARVDRGLEHLDRFVRYSQADLLPYAPVTRAHVGAGGMAFGDLCAAAVEQSDNTAANLILESIGGPAGWTHFVRTLGDASSRLDRTEPALNTSIAGDARDTTTPLAMLADLQLVVLGKVLAPASRERLASWMVQCQTGLSRLRAGLPAAWRIGDKTGTGEHGASGDIAVVWRAGDAPVVIASYIRGAHATDAARDQAYAEVGRIVALAFNPKPTHG
jgi:beta-lactamase class A